MPAFKTIKTCYQNSYNENWLGPVLKKLEWAQQPNVEKRMGGLYHKNTAFPEPEDMIDFKSSFSTTQEADSSGPTTFKMTELSSLKALHRLDTKF